MTEIIPVKTSVKRRRFSKAFKTKIIAACNQPGTSVAGVALANGLNTNLVHRWLRLAKDKPAPAQPAFLPVPLSVPSTASSATVIIEINDIKVHWPLSSIGQSVAWLRALQA